MTKQQAEKLWIDNIGDDVGSIDKSAMILQTQLEWLQKTISSSEYKVTERLSLLAAFHECYLVVKPIVSRILKY